MFIFCDKPPSLNSVNAGVKLDPLLGNESTNTSVSLPNFSPPDLCFACDPTLAFFTSKSEQHRL